MKFILTILLLFLAVNANATLITSPTTWNNGDTVTAAKLNGNQNAITNVVNGSLDNTNTSSGYRLFKIVATLPSAGNQGDVAFLTSNNTLNLDNGATWQATITPSGTLATGQIPYYNGGWQLLSPGSQYYSLVSNGSSSLPSYQLVSLVNGVTSTLPIANGGTGQTSSNNALNALLPSQTGNSGKVLTTNGTNSSWSGGVVLVSSTQISSASTSGNIAITSGKNYLVVMNVKLTSSTATQFSIRFNADSSSSYDYAYTGQGGLAAITAARGSGTTSILLGGTVRASAQKDINASFNIMNGQNSPNTIWAFGKAVAFWETNTQFGYIDFFGDWAGSATPTSFVVNADQNFTGTIYLYEMAQS